MRVRNTDFSVAEHLDELRRRVLLSLGAVAASAALCMPLSDRLFALLKYPAAGALETLVYFSPEEALLVYMRISFTFGAVLAFPFVIFQIWAFLSPAIDEDVRKNTSWFVLISSAVFLAGCAFAYSILLPAALKFLLSIGRGELEPMISASRYISFVTGFLFACGLVFEMPVLSYLLTRAGAVDHRVLRNKFKYAVVAVVIVAAVITPTGDAFNMTMLALPMLALYEVSIWVSLFSKRR